MKKLIWLLAVGFVATAAAPVATRAQGELPPIPTVNPIVGSAKEIFDRQSKFIGISADMMAADKYTFHPTPDQWTFQKIVSHVAQSDFGACAILSDSTAPTEWKVAETDPKDKLVAAVKASFAYCDDVLSKLPDSKLGDMVKFFNGRPIPRARMLMELTDDVEDHYSQMASYLRLNDMTPPSARPRPKP